MANLEPRRTHHGAQTLGASTSQLPSLPVLAPPLKVHTSTHVSNSHIPNHIRADKMVQELELGIYITSHRLAVESQYGSGLDSRMFARRGSAGSISAKKSSTTKSFFLAKSTWQTDILTFCSHVRLDSVLNEARITHIQARKSRRPLFFHEYLLVFFIAAQNQRFVVRIDRLGKVGSTVSTGWPFGTRHGVPANTAIQEIGLYHIQGLQSGIDSLDGAWLAMDGRWGSDPIATLVTWDNIGTHVSHHIQTAIGGPSPNIQDVSRLLEAILLEMPTYHLTTTNCYFMTRTSLLLLQRCYPSAFACYMGDMSEELVPASELTEPIWAGVVRWHWLFLVLFFLFYIPLVVAFHRSLSQACVWGACKRQFTSIQTNALEVAVHGLVDVPLPVGIMHAYMSSIESAMNELVERLSVEFLGLRESQSDSIEPLGEPFGLICSDGWSTLAVWCALGCGSTLVVFAAFLGGRYGLLALFFTVLCVGIWFNFRFSGSAVGAFEGVDDVFESPTAPQTSAA